MKLRRLGWAGIEIESQGQTLVIDHLIDAGLLNSFMTDERDELVAPEANTATAALLTHLHRDHADVEAIERVLEKDGTVLRPPRRDQMTKNDEIMIGEAEAALAASAYNVREANVGETTTIGPFSATAVFASDGLGSPQVSWVIEADGQRVFHGGDTMWHGAWWDIAKAHGELDAACLPGNGVELNYPHMQPPAKAPAVMTPEQAVDAAAVLQAGKMIPIHFNRTFDHPDYYRPTADAGERIAAAAWDRNLKVEFLEPGAWLDLAS